MATEVRDYFILDVETSPIDFEAYDTLSEEEKLKKLNPIDSRIVAIGIRYRGVDTIFSQEDEKELLDEFWLHWKTIIKGGNLIKVVGFNINNFDLPFIITRSYFHGVEISPFVLKDFIIDIRDKISAYRYGPCRGTLKDFGPCAGATVMDIDGSAVPKLYHEGKTEEIIKYLKNDLLMTDKVFQRIRDTKIVYIDRW
ncbi:MAG: 3'-5' exonuclease [Candidatus Altiarchaeota archaeon]